MMPNIVSVRPKKVYLGVLKQFVEVDGGVISKVIHEGLVGVLLPCNP